MKHLIFICISFLGIFGCNSSKYTTSKHLKLEEATQFSFAKGKKDENGTTSGTSYKLVFNKYDGVEINALWIGKQGIEFESFEDSGKLYIVATRYSQISISSGSDLKVAPIEYEGKALVQLRKDGKNNYLVIEEFKVKDKVIGN